ncbi:MAG: ABC transporter substrate-binding protein [Nitrososphaerales archaeon]
MSPATLQSYHPILGPQAPSPSAAKAPSPAASSSVPSTFIYETEATPSYLDPQVSYYSYDYTILQNVYETLLWYNGSSSTAIIPWLAQNYTLSPDQKTASFTLRSGITFADGEPLNSSAVYFSLNKLLIDDSSAPTSHGTQASWIVQQLLNSSYSGVLGSGHCYNQAYAQAVLAQNFVQITGPLTFTLNLQVPNAAFPYLLSGEWASIVAPQYVMQHDLAAWSTSSNGYTLPYSSLSGNLTQQMNQYFMDQVSTCNAGATPAGCGTTYLDGSVNGSLAGTGPYVLTSVNPSTSDVSLQSNPNYWGGPYQFMGGAKIVPQIKTVEFNYVPQQSTRTLDLQSAAQSGQAMAVDVTGTNLYDVANRTAWLNNNQLVSTIPGVTLYGPVTAFSTLFDPFATNVTNAATGQKYTFQPFADLRWRTAFADSVNMTEINQDVNNKLGQVAINVVSPGLPPAGSYNSTDTPAYSYSPDAAAQLLLSAMAHPITTFTDVNGHPATPGEFNNSFGCTTLSSSGKCTSPIGQSFNLYYATGDTVDQAIFNQIASVIDNISITYNMGLTVGVVPVPSGQFVALSLSGIYYMYALGWFADYPWVIDFTNAMYAPGAAYTAPDSMNFSTMANLSTQARDASSTNNISGLVSSVRAMNQFANQEVMYLWTFYSYNFMAQTSNVQGFFYNPSLSTSAGGVEGPEYLATLY